MEADASWDSSIPDLLYIDEVSFLSVEALNDNQPANFLMATLSFMAIAPGESNLFISNDLLLGDAYANDIPANVLGSHINVNPVPIPTTIFLFGSGIVAMMLRRKKIIF